MRSPCNDNCIMHRELRFCEGCGRTMDEICKWAHMSAEERRALLAELPHRLKRMHGASPNSG